MALRGSHRADSVRGFPRSASDGGAASSNRVPTGAPRCHDGRRGSALPRAADARRISPGRRPHCQRRPLPPCWACWQGRLQRQVVGGHTHPFATAAGRRLDQHGKADLVCARERLPLRLRSSRRCPAPRAHWPRDAKSRARFLSPSAPSPRAWGR